jgi:Icc-related predicted phosphoesterase
MPKFFVVSDIHSFYTEFKEALDAAGFNPNDESHWLVTCGDHFDRGRQSAEVMRYLLKLPRKILIRGNHEQLLMECLDRGYPLMHDASNGTMQTVMDLAGRDVDEFDIACTQIHPRVKKFVDQTVNYFETKNYIFVHGWIPLKDLVFDSLWRDSHQADWDKATWKNGMEMAIRGFVEPNKTIVCGHFHTSWGHHRKDGSPEWGEKANFTPYYSHGIIAIDGCTAYSGRCNVLVLEDEFLESDKYESH